MTLMSFRGQSPQIHARAFVAPGAIIIGDVTVGAGASIWFGAVLRGDSGAIVIGAGSNIQDNVVVHVNKRHPTIVGARVTVGHGVVLEGCSIGPGALIGMGARVLDGAEIGAGALVAAGSVVREGMVVPASALAAGVPAVIKGPVTDAARERVRRAPESYEALAALYQAEAEVVARPPESRRGA